MGDGATNEGAFHEAVNMAAIWDLPVVFVCENNLYGASTPVGQVTRLEHLADRAAAYGIPGVTRGRMDVLAVHEARWRRRWSGRASGGRPDADRVRDVPVRRPLAQRHARVPDA